MPPSKFQASSDAPAGSFNTFRVAKPTNESSSIRKRAKLGPQQRLEVKAVRERRACLRCSLLKIKCSDSDCCATCKKLSFAIYAHEKQTLSFSGCIRTRLHEVSIFELYIPAPDQQNLIINKGQNLSLSRIALEFTSEVTWDLGSIANDIVDWLNDPMASKTSKVGTLSSPRFLELVRSSIQENTIVDFQRMIYAISLAYTQPTSSDKHFLTVSELYQVGSMAGHSFLRNLDKKLRPQSLKNCSCDDLRALFLLVVGTILAVGYVEEVANDTPLSDTEMFSKLQHQPVQIQAIKSHLCQILAHYILFLGSKLKLAIPTTSKQSILKTALSRWNKKGVFQWKNRMENEVGFYSEDWLAEDFHRAHKNTSCVIVGLDSSFPHPLQPSLQFYSDTGLQTYSDELPLDLNSLNTSADVINSCTASTLLTYGCSSTTPMPTLELHHPQDSWSHGPRRNSSPSNAKVSCGKKVSSPTAQLAGVIVLVAVVTMADLNINVF
ncbi:hypothetical protein B0O99DRAFT_594602 [Bisporella sp. PMI_857]|nr:hypothetical protein B0O99DRAFT_594602 [Bisporella sp. PMI_857]